MWTKKTTKHETNSKDLGPAASCNSTFPTMPGLTTNKSFLLQSYKAGMVVHSSNSNT